MEDDPEPGWSERRTGTDPDPDDGHPAHRHEHVAAASAGHSHDLRDLSSSFDQSLRRRLNLIGAGLFVVTLVGVAFWWPHSDRRADPGSLGVADGYFDATVTAVDPFDCPGTAPSTVDPGSSGESGGATKTTSPVAGSSSEPAVCLTVTFLLEQGPDAGEERTVELFDWAPYPEVEVGDQLVVPYLEDALPEYQYAQSFERERRWPLVALAIAFAVLVVVQGGLRGFAALAGLVASIGVIVVFVLPALVGGEPPVPVAIAAASLVAYLALYLAHGFSPLTTVALLGTLASLVLVGVLSWVFTELTVLSGLSEEAQYIRAFGGDLEFGGLLLAGIILGALGALDDMTVTQASAVAELRRADPTMGFAALYRAGSRIGRDHIASTVNTLALAYAGASLPLLVLFIEYDRPLSRVLTSEVVATELVRTLVGSIGLVASVPLTTLLAARLVAPRRRDAGPDILAR
ncbi:MAG: YibE/F family protein [Actinobacteria bacterium]|nr:YibE/F family protein [Actinomycetota bacterium]